MVLTLVFSFILLIVTILYLVIRRNHNYWEKRNVPHIKPTFLFGNYREWILGKEYLGISVQKLCKNFPNEPFFGAYIGTEPAIVVQDPEMIRLITTKEFSYFNSRDLMDFTHKETFGRSLVATYGEDWKLTRTNLTPMFTSSKLRSMFPLIEECAIDFEKFLNDENKCISVEARELFSTYTMAVFVSCAFGIDLKNFEQAEVFTAIGKKFFEVSRLRSMKLFVRSVWPSLFYGLGLRVQSSYMGNFFRKLLKDVFQTRGYKLSARRDFIDSLLTLKETAGSQCEHIDDEYMIAQSLSNFLGGYESSAGTVSFFLYEIAKHEDIQAKVHKEIDEYLKKTDGKITYDCLTELPYLNACLDETMRMYPIIGVLTREVTKNYTLPSGLVLEKGLRINFPVYHLHRNPDFFPNPEEFRPERFYGETKQQIVPYSYLPFGEGPRICIGKRFAMLQILPGLVTIFRKYKIVLAEGMPTKVELEPNLFVTMAKGGIHLTFLHRT